MFRNEAKNIGESTAILIDRVLSSRVHEVHSFKTCKGILNLKNKYGKRALEEVAKEANLNKVTSYKSIKALLDLYLSSFEEAEEALTDIDPNEFFITHTQKEKKQ